MDFFSELEVSSREKGTLLCIGLDPALPEGLFADGEGPLGGSCSPGATGRSGEWDERCAAAAARAFESNRRLVEATLPFAACYKPNIAFYEALGPAGIEALERTLALLRGVAPVILDAKRGDIDNTAKAYARAVFGRMGAGAVTLSPYMGKDTIQPFLDYPGRGVFLLCRTSNPGAPVFQDLDIQGEPLYARVARECALWSDRVGLVVAGNDVKALRTVRAAAPGAWFLSPGIGAQGGKADEALMAGSRRDGTGILVMAARAVAGAADPAAAARDLRDAIRAAAGLAKAAAVAVPGTPADKAGAGPAIGTAAGQAHAESGVAALKKKLITAMVSTGCFRLGDFILKSGKRSPFYLDLRRLVSDPAAMLAAADAYASMADRIGFDRLAGIPAAGLPLATAAALRISRPMVWPRMPVKEHGTGNRIEGEWKPGERALLLDDLITTGASKKEALDILRGEGLVVSDLVVLAERGRQGRLDMEASGVRLHAFMHVRELFGVCEELGMIDGARRGELERFVDGE